MNASNIEIALALIGFLLVCYGVIGIGVLIHG